MAGFGTVTIDVAVDVKHNLVLGTTPDGHPEVWLLYSPEPYPPGSYDDRAIPLWVRRANVFSSREAAMIHPERLTGYVVEWRPYDPLFPELWVGTDGRGARWLMEPAPILGAGEQHA